MDASKSSSPSFSGKDASRYAPLARSAACRWTRPPGSAPSRVSSAPTPHLPLSPPSRWLRFFEMSDHRKPSTTTTIIASSSDSSQSPDSTASASTSTARRPIVSRMRSRLVRKPEVSAAGGGREEVGGTQMASDGLSCSKQVVAPAGLVGSGQAVDSEAGKIRSGGAGPGGRDDEASSRARTDPHRGQCSS